MAFDCAIARHNTDESMDICEDLEQVLPSPRSSGNKRSAIEAAIEADAPCSLCDLGVGDNSPSELTMALGGRRVSHKTCYNGSHCLQRIVDKLSEDDPGIKQRVRDIRNSDPMRYKAIALSLRSELHSRNAAQRGKARTFVTEMVQSTTVARKEACVLLSFRQYIAWYGMHEQMTAEEAAEQWHREVMNPNKYREEKGGQTFLSVEMPTEISKSSAVSKRRKIATESAEPSEGQTREFMQNLQRPMSLPDGVGAALGAGALSQRPEAAELDNIMDGLGSGAASSSSGLAPTTPQWMIDRFRHLRTSQPFVAPMPHTPLGPPPQTPLGPPPVPAAMTPPIAAMPAQAPMQAAILQAPPAAQPPMPPQPATPQPQHPAIPAEPAPAQASQPVAQEADGDEEQEPDEPEDVFAITAETLRAYSMSQFITFKKDVRQNLLDSLKENMSNVRGKTWAQLIEGTMESDPTLATDQDLQQLEIAACTARTEELRKSLKEYLDKTIAMWKYKDIKVPEFHGNLSALATKKREFLEAVEEMKQVASIVRELQLGMKKEALQAKKRTSYKVTRYTKQMVENGMPENLSKLLAKTVSACEDDKPMNAFGRMPQELEFYSTEYPDFLFQHLKMIAEGNEPLIFGETTTLIGQMKSTTIMKPIAVEMPQKPVPGTKPEMFAELTDPLMKPWLIIATALTSSWGQLRWPVMGLPFTLVALDDHCVFAGVPISTLMAKGMSAEKCDWLECDKLREEDVCVAALRKNEGVSVPFGMAVCWTFVPSSGAVDKPDKAGKGKVLVRWNLKRNTTAASGIELEEVKHTWSKLLAATGTTRPWSTIREPLQRWLDSVEVASTT